MYGKRATRFSIGARVLARDVLSPPLPSRGISECRRSRKRRDKVSREEKKKREKKETNGIKEQRFRFNAFKFSVGIVQSLDYKLLVFQDIRIDRHAAGALRSASRFHD